MGESMELNNGLGPETIRDMTSERDRLRIEVAELRKQLDETQRQIEIWKEKYRHSEEQVALLDQDWHSMFRLLPRELQVTEEDILEIRRDPHTFEELWGLFEQHESK